MAGEAALQQDGGGRGVSTTALR